MEIREKGSRKKRSFCTVEKCEGNKTRETKGKEEKPFFWEEREKTREEEESCEEEA